MNKEVKELIDTMQEYANGFTSVLAPTEESVNALLDYINQLEEDYKNELEENLKLSELWRKSQEEKRQLETNWNELKGWLISNDVYYPEAILFKETLHKMRELEGGSNENNK